MSELGQLIYEDLVGRGRRLRTGREWRAMVERFVEVCGVKESYGRADVIKYLTRLRELGHKQNTINKELKPIRLLADIQGWRDDFPKLAMPKVRLADVYRPIFTKEEMERIIKVGQKKLKRQYLCYLALASTYGLRREELTSMDQDDVNSGGTITVKTAKGGDEVTQLVPKEIKGILSAFKPVQVARMTKVFRHILAVTGVHASDDGYGWHSIRRALATELLLKDVSALNIMRFMRWSEESMRGEFGMLSIYAQRNQAEVDKAIFQAHPFLKFWRKEGKGEEDAGGSDEQSS